MPAPVAILLVAALLPLAAFVVLTFVGGWLAAARPGPGSAAAGWIGTAAVGGSFLCTLVALYEWLAAAGVPARVVPWGLNKPAVLLTTPWLPADPSAPGRAGWLDVGLYVDSLTLALFAVVTLVAFLVHVFAIGYLRGDTRSPRFFAHLSLFGAAMLGLVLSATLVQLFVCWELVGACSYLLVGYRVRQPVAGRAAIKAFLFNRVGDAAFLVGMGILYAHVGNLSLPHLWATLGSAGQGGGAGVATALPGGGTIPAGVVTAAGLCLFLAAAAKSAQFPLHAWLPDAMAGPTPASALIHAATMVAAGVYLVARLFPILTPDAKLVIAAVGCGTLLLGALAAVAQTDLKRVLAYSTVSQLGYMMLAVGVGSWVGALFHLVTHAFFKALLFLSAGSVIHSAGHAQDLRRYGGLWRRLPVTAACMAVGVLAIAAAGIGPWGLSGYYSKATILTDAAAYAVLATGGGGGGAAMADVGSGRSGVYWLLFAVPAAGGLLTAFYMTRCWVLTFAGRPRDPALFAAARETPMMYVPLIALAAMSVIGGWDILSVRTLLTASRAESDKAVARLIDRAAAADRRATAATMSAMTTATGPASRRTAAAFSGWQTAWPAVPPTAAPAVEVAGPRPTTSDASPDAAADAPALTASQRAHAEGHRVETLVAAYAWVPGLLLAAALYRAGHVAPRRLALHPLAGRVRAWLVGAMYLDELYAAAVATPAKAAAFAAGWADRHGVDAAVNAVATGTERAARGAGWHDRHVVDGGVAGVARAARAVGSAARSPQTGRVRLYVMVLMAAAIVGLAVAVGVAVWR